MNVSTGWRLTKKSIIEDNQQGTGTFENFGIARISVPEIGAALVPTESNQSGKVW